MADEIDMAQHTEALHLAAALSAVGCSGEDDADGPVMILGVACCCDCLEPIPLERLLAVPGACRCVACQSECEKT